MGTLPLTIWFLAFYLIGQAQNGIFSIELSRHLGVSLNIAWLLHSKIMRSMIEREDTYVLQGREQLDDAYLGGDRSGGKAGRGSENMVPIVSAILLNRAGNPIYSKISAVSGFTSEKHGRWAQSCLGAGCACFPMVWPAYAP
jgi:hypothetical protein